MGEARHQAIVLDAGALIAFERADPRMRALLREVTRAGIRLIVPAGVVAQVFRDARPTVGRAGGIEAIIIRGDTGRRADGNAGSDRERLGGLIGRLGYRIEALRIGVAASEHAVAIGKVRIGPVLLL